ncbi:Retrovirus-related Pol polyprotein from transposon 17.6 [Araneus ventricosus]|uniref:Retrovirus-related Pol polyprotein from transposon 17.6 n=1 Tax=Araneus ventricosus TaxID=182803 RepID=A0A4Y2VQ08_ARAVE|nr:Retrovirus-related Pol polyprotein from transposon 17.6 [Araneus ventricosus]
MDAKSLNAKPESQKVAILLRVIGVECLEIYNTFNEVSSASMNDILAKFEACFVPQRNITYERQRLFLLVQREGQSVDNFITELRKQHRNCDYGSLNDYVLVDQLVRGLRESRLREHLLRVPDLNIKKAVDMCRAAETSKLQAQVYFTEERSIDAIKRFKPSPEVKPRDTGQVNKLRQPAKRQKSSRRKCRYCGSRHIPDRCPAYGKQYRSCGKQNQFSRVCKSKSVSRVCQNKPEEFTNSANSCKYPPKQFFVGNVSADSMSSSWQAILLINDRPVNFKIDTGAQANIISKKLLNDMYGSGVNVRKTSVKLSTYTGQTIELLGCTTLPVKKDLNSPVIHLDFLVTKNSYQPILGLTASADKLGHTLSSDGIAIDKSKLEPILSMSKPEDRQSLHRYLVMINYLSKFLPNLSTLIAPLRELFKNNTVWLLDPSYDKIFDQVKEQLTKSPVLAFFDPRIESEIVVDASPFGLGAVLQQRGKPIAFASSALTPAQRNYAHIEKELLAVVYRCKKFHQTLPELQPGSSVFVQNRVRQWEPAEVLHQNEIPRSYRIRTYNGEVKRRNRIHLRPNKCSDFASFKNFTDSEEYSTSDAIQESTPTVRPQEPVDEPASNSQSGQESSSYDPISRSPDKGPYRTRYGRVVKPPSRYVAKF